MLTNFKRTLFARVALQIPLIWSCYGYINKKSDDLDIVALKTIVEQQAAMIATLQSEMTALKNSLPRSFQQVRFSADNGQTGIPITSGQTLKFDNIITNLGNAYDARTGVFTAPIPGLYSFFLVVMSPDETSYLVLAIVKNGVQLDLVYGNGRSDPDDQGSTQVTMHLAAGEMVWVQQASGEGVRGSNWTVFTGYLLVADKPS
ncbi:hypothetical protein C0Q70_05802 [Pomacea canaliculata]|uniref:C1q domain-containing protein n=1 Tax=Pomacea canaliculata TaxID=400727 RepID=A0A2T7PMC1_POMCA|nr:hypothetical protein C0Q70_05802 [Pomacea canaliculata]